jgi:hypothetical protein
MIKSVIRLPGHLERWVRLEKETKFLSENFKERDHLGDQTYEEDDIKLDLIKYRVRSGILD